MTENLASAHLLSLSESVLMTENPASAHLHTLLELVLMTENPAPAHLLTLLALQNVAIYVEIVAGKRMKCPRI